MGGEFTNPNQKGTRFKTVFTTTAMSTSLSHLHRLGGGGGVPVLREEGLLEILTGPPPAKLHPVVTHVATALRMAQACGGGDGGGGGGGGEG